MREGGGKAPRPRPGARGVYRCGANSAAGAAGTGGLIAAAFSRLAAGEQKRFLPARLA